MINKLLHKYEKIIRQLFGFMITGFPAFLLAIPLNWFLVEYILLFKPIAYLITLLFQVSINFFMLRKFVFTDKKDVPVFTQYLQFLAGISVFRFLDWGLYSLLTYYTDFYYLFIQIGNVLIFSIFKFIYSKYILEKRKS